MIHVILNPASGAGRARKAWGRAAALVEAAGYQYVVHETSRRGDGERIARELAAGVATDTIVAVGGDGSLNEIINGLLTAAAGRPLPSVGICPVGSGNDLARSLGIGRGPEELLRLLAHNACQSVDAWQVAWPTGSRWFINVASCGFTGSAAAIIDRRGKRFRGLSYVYGAILALGHHRDIDVRVSCDSGAPSPLSISAAVFANAPWFGSGMHVAPGADTGDGRLDLLTVRGAGRLRLLGLLGGVYSGRHLRSPFVSHHLVGKVELDWTGELPFEADGEPIAVTPPVTIVCRPGAFRFRLPAARDR